MAAVAGAGSATATLTAATLDTVTLSQGVGGSMAEITNHGDGVLYCRAGASAVVAADECTVVLAGERLAVGLSAAGTITVISAVTPTYTVAIP